MRQFFGSLRSEEHTSELQSRSDLVCRLLLEKKKNNTHSPQSVITIRFHGHAQTLRRHQHHPTPILRRGPVRTLKCPLLREILDVSRPRRSLRSVYADVWTPTDELGVRLL